MSTARTYTLDDVKGKDVTKIKADVDELTKALHEVSAVVYQEAAKQGTEEGKTEEKEEKGDYVDVEYDVKDEENKQSSECLIRRHLTKLLFHFLFYFF